MRQLIAAAFALSFCIASSAQISLSAQYQWVDLNGQMVFSDQPPPASVPLSRILRVGDPVAAPSKPNAGANSPSKQIPPNAANASGQEVAQPSIDEQMAAFDKRRTARKEERRQRLKQAKQAKATAQSCKRMQVRKQQLDSGLRLRAPNKQGVMAPMTEDERFALARAVTKKLKKCTT